ncbi:MAG: hypothetical protein H0X51_08460 [Parachlamydiaceae bacterium]|nr:hypothetical protein [Parachlamydiaceae bacterium]
MTAVFFTTVNKATCGLGKVEAQTAPAQILRYLPLVNAFMITVSLAQARDVLEREAAKPAGKPVKADKEAAAGDKAGSADRKGSEAAATGSAGTSSVKKRVLSSATAAGAAPGAALREDEDEPELVPVSGQKREVTSGDISRLQAKYLMDGVYGNIVTIAAVAAGVLFGFLSMKLFVVVGITLSALTAIYYSSKGELIAFPVEKGNKDKEAI